LGWRSFSIEPSPDQVSALSMARIRVDFWRFCRYFLNQEEARLWLSLSQPGPRLLKREPLDSRKRLFPGRSNERWKRLAHESSPALSAGRKTAYPSRNWGPRQSAGNVGLRFLLKRSQNRMDLSFAAWSAARGTESPRIGLSRILFAGNAESRWRRKSFFFLSPSSSRMRISKPGF
jgi:hypothetical protein